MWAMASFNSGQNLENARNRFEVDPTVQTCGQKHVVHIEARSPIDAGMQS